MILCCPVHLVSHEDSSPAGKFYVRSDFLLGIVQVCVETFLDSTSVLWHYLEL